MRRRDIRVAGELDDRHLDTFSQALTETLALDHTIDVNLAGLQFLDVPVAGAILHAAQYLVGLVIPIRSL
jgi:anti-anti-sigma regulatory factor